MNKSPSSSSLLATIQERADDILSARAGITGGMSSACMKHASEISNAVEWLRSTEETEVPFGPGMDRPEPHADGVSRLGENVRPVCYKAETDDRSQEHKSARRQLEAASAARFRTAKARKKSRSSKRMKR